MVDSVINLYAEYGLIGLIVVCFFVLVIWVIMNSKHREDKLYQLINTLSTELPEIRKELNEIKTELKIRKKKING